MKHPTSNCYFLCCFISIFHSSFVAVAIFPSAYWCCSISRFFYLFSIFCSVFFFFFHFMLCIAVVTLHFVAWFELIRGMVWIGLAIGHFDETNGNFKFANTRTESERVRSSIPYETVRYGEIFEHETFDIYGIHLSKGKDLYLYTL